MNSATRELLPSLPPELRNEIYNYLSTATPTTSGLPLKLKTFECKHSTVQICPVHYGSIGLLSLETYGFQEASEYSSWLLNNATELRIGVAFNGRVNTFVQHDWDKKIEAHLRKLAKQHPWLKKVARYNVQILWNPIDGVLKSRKNKRTAGQITRDISATLTKLADGDVRMKKGNLNVKLSLDHGSAMASVGSGITFGFADFFALPASEDFRRQTREVYIESPTPVQANSSSRLIPVPPIKPEKKKVMEVGRDTVRWIVGTNSRLVFRKHLLDGLLIRLEAGVEEEKVTIGDSLGYAALSFLAECLVQR